MKQTAIEWLEQRIRVELTYEQDVLFDELFEQAKEMEKEQIKFFFEKGHLYSGCPYGFDEIYNKTFKSE